MPKIYEYLGYVFLIYTDDHLPIHVHVTHGETSAKVELLYDDGVLTVSFRRVRGQKLLTAKQQQEVKTFVEMYHESIIEKWNQIHVLHTRVKAEKITQKIK